MECPFETVCEKHKKKNWRFDCCKTRRMMRRRALFVLILVSVAVTLISSI